MNDGNDGSRSEGQKALLKWCFFFLRNPNLRKKNDKIMNPQQVFPSLGNKTLG